MKIKDIVQESVYDWFTQRDAARAQASSQQQARTKAAGGPALLTAAMEKTTAWLLKQGPKPTPQEQDMVDQYREQQEAPAIDWQTGTIKQTTPATPAGPVEDIKDTLDANTQYRFPNPDYPGVQIIVRNSGWYIDKLPVELRGQIRRDKTTGLYPVLQPNNIKKYNLYYNQAAENKQVREEPAAAL